MRGDLYYETLRRAVKLGVERHPQAYPEHHIAFGNAVSTLVAGWGETLSGPSMRERFACKVGEKAGTIGQFAFEDAVSLTEEICYGPLDIGQATMLYEKGCKNNAPGEVAKAHLILNAYYRCN